MASASWHETFIARSDDTVVVEGNHYFPLDSVVAGVLEPSDATSRCPWKGTASYFDVRVDGDVLRDAAWTYPQPSRAASPIRGRVAFWKGVNVQG